MELIGTLIFVAVGAAVGWLAAILKRRGRFGQFVDTLIAGLGAWSGNYVFGWLSLAAFGWKGGLSAAVLGAIVFLFLFGLIKRS